MPIRPRAPDRISTGIAGLDEILLGGLPRGRTYLVRGQPGTGKTTLALQFVLEGLRSDERPALYISLAETLGELTEVARSHGWSLAGLPIHQLVDRPDRLVEEAQTTLFHPSEVELGELVEEIVARVRELGPGRVVIDSIAELRLLAHTPLRFRRQILALKQLFADQGTTALLLDEQITDNEPHQLESVAHGVLALEQQAPVYGPERRRLRVVKVRGLRYLGGYHDFEIVTGGLTVYPRLVELGAPEPPAYRIVSSQVPGLDRLLGGGIERGSSTLFLGQAGVGKSGLVTHLAGVLADEGIPTLIHVCDERISMYMRRAESLGIAAQKHLGDGRLVLRQIDPGDMSPGRLVQQVREAVEDGGIGAVAFDSLNGLSRAMYDDPSLELRLRELLTWLARRGVINLLTVSQAGLVGQVGGSPVDLSYLADTVVLLRHFESLGEVHKSVSVMKRRSGAHDPTIRELVFGSDGIEIGPPLRDLRGILTTVPEQASPNGGSAEPEDGRRP
jgi:circadian clock protein KaiC